MFEKKVTSRYHQYLQLYLPYMSSSYSLGQPLDICRSDTPLDLCLMVRRQDGHLPKSYLALNYN